MANYKFRTPIVDEGPAGAHRLFTFYKLHRGITIVKEGGVYKQVRYQQDSYYDGLSEVYMGGTEKTVSEATKAALIAGGVGVTEANFTAL